MTYASYLYHLRIVSIRRQYSYGRLLQYLTESTGTNYSLLDKIQCPEVRKILT